MKLRIVEYFGCRGGIERFLTQILWQIIDAHHDVEMELVSYGSPLNMYRERFASMAMPIHLLSIKPSNYWRAQWPPFIWGIRGTSFLQHLLGAGTQGYYDVPHEVFDGCDVVWFPSVSRHRIPADYAHRAIGTLHDVIALQIEGVLSRKLRFHEWETTRRWLTSDAHIALTSRTTQTALEDMFALQMRRSSVIPILAEHERIQPVREVLGAYQWTDRPFVICPANTSPHKNHTVLIQGVAAWGATHPLVLSGWLTDLRSVEQRPIAKLRRLIEAEGFKLGESLIPLGYIDISLYHRLLEQAWALVMPTLAEGGGSYPVLEAMLAGIPVACSNIPIMREHLERTGGHVLWFDPYDPQDLARCLYDLEANYQDYKAQAVAQANGLRVDSWADIADAYWRIMTAIAKDEKAERKAVVHV